MTGDNDTRIINIPIDFLFNYAEDIIAVYDTRNTLLMASDSFYAFFGIERAAEPRDIFIPVVDGSAWLDVDYEKQQFFSRPYDQPVTIEMMTRQGNHVIEWSRKPVFDHEGALDYIVAIGKPKEEQKESLKNLIYYDDLTGLYKRNYLIDVVEKKVMSSEVPSSGIVIQICGLESVTRILGEKISNRLVDDSARKIEGLAPEESTICRISEDKFFIFYPNYKAVNAVRKLACDISSAINEILKSVVKDVPGQASIGIAYYPSQVTTMTGLLYYANVALNHASENKTCSYCEFREAFKEEAIDNYVLMKDLKRAVNDDEFIIHYQPIIDPETMAVEAVEALVRWNHPDYGLISPSKFIKLAEATGMLSKVGICVMEKVKTQMENWTAVGLNHHAVSINMASCQMAEKRLDKTVARIFKGVDCNRVRFELTDCASLDASEVVKKNIDNLRKMGIKIAIGDLGLEYSKLSLLDKLDFDVIKIDKFFVQQNESGKVTGLVMEMLKKMMVAMNTIYIKEGIETKEQLSAMQNLGFSLMQGYYFSKPVDAGEITRMIENGVSLN